MNGIVCEFYFDDSIENIRKRLFKNALVCSKYGKVLYVLKDELNELPDLSQDLNQIERYSMKMIIFLYAADLRSLVEGVATLPNWQNVPTTIILDDLTDYCSKENFQNACGVVAFLMDTICSCSHNLKCPCKLYIGARKTVLGEEYCNILKELYLRTVSDDDDQKLLSIC